LANDGIFPFFIVTEMPVGVAGLIVAAIFAASQSTVSSSLNSFATAYTTDFHRRWRPETSDGRALVIARRATLLIGLLGIALAMFLANLNDVRSLWETFLAILGLFGGTVSGLFALGIFTRRAHGLGALLGALGSVTLVVCVYLFGWMSFWLYSAIGVCSCCLGGYFLSLILPGTARTQGLTIYSMQLAPKSKSGTK
jgi:Na+/proline symporter